MSVQVFGTEICILSSCLLDIDVVEVFVGIVEVDMEYL